MPGRTRTGNSWARWAAGLLLTALLLPLIQAGQDDQETKVKGGPPEGTAAQRRKSVNNLKQIAIAFHAYNDTYQKLPASAWRQEGGGPQLTGEQLAKAQGKFEGKTLPLFSWRVALLPYLEESELYKQFKIDEPWDSEHNKKLIPKMPRVYAPVTGKVKEGLTYYQVFVGKDAPFDGTLSRGLRAFTDGLSNTFLVVEAGEAVPWTKPQDILYDAKGPLPKLGGLFSGGFHAAMADGTVRFIPRRGVGEKTLRLVIEPRDGLPTNELPGEPAR